MRKKNEANLTTKLKKHILASGISIGNCAIEVKVTTEKSIPFDAVQEHQLLALKQATQVFAYKIPDDSRGAKPFDMFTLQNARAYVAIAFLVPRVTPVVYLVPVHVWVALSESSKRKSVTEQMLRETDRVITLALSTTEHSQSLS